MGNGNKLYFLFALLSLAVVSCRKDTPPVLPQQQGSITTGKRLLICDEGGFGYNNAGVSIYDPSSNAIIVNAYTASNSNQNLGDVLQSVTKFNDKYYLVVNNSGKVVVCDKNFVRLTTIGGFISPRYMQVVSNNKAYVSNLKLPNNPNQTNYIQVLDIATNTISKSIRLDGWTEQMVQSYGKVYITNQNRKYVYVIDALNDNLDSIYVGATNACIVKDANEKLWVSCNADSANNISAKLVKINSISNSIDTSISLQTIHHSISRLCINGNGTTLYY
ncbi:MAG: YncE family protein, partial [Bacteroidia bacterium]